MTSQVVLDHLAGEGGVFHFPRGFLMITFEVVIFYTIRLRLHGAIHRPDSFLLMLRYCANLKTISYESTSLNRIVADKSHRVIVA